MAKRFIDTKIFEDEWYMELDLEAKLFYIYLFVNCDHAGVIKLNKKLCQFQTGINNLDRVIEQLGNRLVSVKDGIYFLPKFLKYQYPNFPNSKVIQQNSALKILNDLNIDYKSSLTLNGQLPNYHDNESDNVHDNGNIIKVWISTFGRNPNLMEQEETEKHFKEFGIDKTKRIYKEAYKKGFRNIFKLTEQLNPDGSIKPKDGETPKPHYNRNPLAGIGQ
jgi:hypothetical protein